MICWIFEQSSVQIWHTYDWGKWKLENNEIQICIIYMILIFMGPKMYV